MRVFDSNVLIYHLNDALPPSVLTQVESWIAEGAVISVMSRIEVLGYPQTADQLQQAMRLLAYFTASEAAVLLRRRGAYGIRARRL
jgi:predicted nucleic acid-binding protein